MNFIIFIFLSSLSFAEITLKDSFWAAKNNMETLKKSDALIEQAIARKNKYRAGFLPTVSGIASETRIDPPKTNGNTAFTLTRQYSYALRLQQPLIRGGVLSNFSYAREDIILAEFQKNASEVSLYQLVIGAFFNLYLAKKDLESLRELESFSLERVKELKTRAAVGKSRKGELVQAETQLYSVKSQVELGEYNLKNAEEYFEFYTKLTPEKISVDDMSLQIKSDVEYYRQKMNSRPDVLAKLQEVKLAEKQIEIAKGGHYPSLDLIGNYYFDRTGILSTSEWDVGLSLNFPLFQGGSVYSGVRESVEKHRFSELNSSEYIRGAKRDLDILYLNYTRLSDQLKTLKEALVKAESAYKLNTTDYRYGQATNLEVLQSLNLFIDTKRSYNTILVETYKTIKNLEAAAGELP